MDFFVFQIFPGSFHVENFSFEMTFRDDFCFLQLWEYIFLGLEIKGLKLSFPFDFRSEVQNQISS